MYSITPLYCSMKKEPYEALINKMVEGATVLDHSKSPCEENFVPDTKVA